MENPQIGELVIRRANCSGKWGLFRWESVHCDNLIWLEKCTCPSCAGHIRVRPFYRDAWRCVFGGYATAEEVANLSRPWGADVEVCRTEAAR